MSIQQGKVTSVVTETAGDEAVQAHAVGDTTLYVNDTADFDESGGRLSIDGIVYFYDSIDDDASTIALSSPLTAAVDDDTPILVYPTSYSKSASVMIEDGEDAVVARIPMFLTDSVDDGVRSIDDQESALLELQGEDWVVVDILGLSGVRGVQFFQDTATATSDGSVVVNLTYEPILNSEHVYWNGIYQPEGNFVRVGLQITITDSDITIGDIIDVEYAYIGVGTTPDPPSPPPLSNATLVGNGSGTPNSTNHTLSFAAPSGAAAGDLLVFFVRGDTGAGGGEFSTDVTTSDARLSLLYRDPNNIAGVWSAVHDGTSDPYVFTFATGSASAGVGIVAALRDTEVRTVNGQSPAPANTATIEGNAAIAGGWNHGSFVTYSTSPPPGYTLVGMTPNSYSSLGVGFWRDDNASTSPTGAYSVEGECVIGLG